MFYTHQTYADKHLYWWIGLWFWNYRCIWKIIFLYLNERNILSCGRKEKDNREKEIWNTYYLNVERLEVHGPAFNKPCTFSSSLIISNVIFTVLRSKFNTHVWMTYCVLQLDDIFPQFPWPKWTLWERTFTLTWKILHFISLCQLLRNNRNGFYPFFPSFLLST